MDLILKELNMEEFDSLKRSIWSPLRKHSIKPMEILPFIRGFSENDIDEITSAAKNRTKNESIDNLYEAIRRRNLDCFKSFLAALLEHEYVNLWMEILKIGKTILSNRNSPSLKTKEILTQVNNTQKSDQQNSKYTKKIPLTEDTELGEVPVEVTDRWAAELNKDKLWRELSKKLGFLKKEVMGIEKSENAGDAFLDELTFRGFRVVDLMKHLQGEKCSNFLEIIRLDLDYNNLNIDYSPVDGAARFGNVSLSLPCLNDSSRKLKANIQNNVMNSPSQSSSNSLESSSLSRSSLAKTSTSEKILNSSKQDMECIAETGHNILYGCEIKSAQKDYQQSELLLTLISKCEEKLEHYSSEIMANITENQNVIARNEQLLSFSADHDHQTSQKSTILGDNLNTLDNLSMEPNELTSEIFIEQLSKVNTRTSSQTMSQTESPKPQEPVVHQEQDSTACQKGSSLLQGISYMTINSEEVGYERKSNGARNSWSFINTPVYPALADTEVGNPVAAHESSTNQSSQFDLFQTEPGHRFAENIIGSQHMQGPYKTPVPVSDDTGA